MTAAARGQRSQPHRQRTVTMKQLAAGLIIATLVWACRASNTNLATAGANACSLALIHGPPAADSILPIGAMPRNTGPADTLDATVYLVGDVGYPVEATGSVLAHVRSQIEAQAQRIGSIPGRSQQWVVYLGDNAYPAGLPPATPDSQPERGHALCILEQQVEAVPAPAQAVFLAGNHDWRPTGCVKEINAQIINCIRSLQSKDPIGIEREAKLLDGVADGRISFRPRGGCPGPSEIRVGSRLVLVVFDSEWMLRHVDGLPDGGCRGLTFSGVVDSISAHAQSAPPSDFVMLAAHHPLQSGGEHGNACGGPNGLAGVAVTDIRRAAEIGQDFSGDGYSLLRRRLIDRLNAARRSIAYASGHDHTLQVFAGGPRGRAVHYLVSGAGSVGTHESSCVRWEPGMVYPFAGEGSARETPNGFMRVDVYRPAGVRVTVFTVSDTGVLARSASFVLE